MASLKRKAIDNIAYYEADFERRQIAILDDVAHYIKLYSDDELIELVSILTSADGASRIADITFDRLDRDNFTEVCKIMDFDVYDILINCSGMDVSSSDDQWFKFDNNNLVIIDTQTYANKLRKHVQDIAQECLDTTTSLSPPTDLQDFIDSCEKAYFD